MEGREEDMHYVCERLCACCLILFPRQHNEVIAEPALLVVSRRGTFSTNDCVVPG